MKLNLIDDGNFMLHRSFTAFRQNEFSGLLNSIKVLKKNLKSVTIDTLKFQYEQDLIKQKSILEKKELDFFNDENRVNRLVQKCLMDIFAGIKSFGKINRYIYVSDGNSWRKNVEIEENNGYKSNRKVLKDKSYIDYKYLYTELYNVIKLLLKSNNIEVYNVSIAEGDDLMALFAKKFLEKGESTICKTADKDMYQICEVKNGNFIAIFNPVNKDKKIVSVKGFKKLIYEKNTNTGFEHLFNVKIQNVKSFDTTQIKQLISNGCELVEIDTTLHVFTKILQGDDGDAVPPCYLEYSKSICKKTGQEKSRRKLISGKKLKYIYENFSEYDVKTLYKSDILREKLAKIVLETYITKTSNKTEDIKLIKSIAYKLKRNIILMTLQKFVMPTELLLNFEKIWEKNDNNTNKYKPTNYHKILENTKYANVSKNKKTNKKTFDNDNIFKKFNTDFLKNK